MAEAFGHRSYILLVLGFFTCGFQLGFVTLHLPAYLMDRGLSAEIGGWTFGVIGLFNIVGAMTVGLARRPPAEALHPLVHLFRPRLDGGLPHHVAGNPGGDAHLRRRHGLLWLSSVPPTSGLVVVMFGTRWLAMLFGVAFFSHQVGGFLGVYLGGLLFERTGSYDAVWWLGVCVRCTLRAHQPADRREAGRRGQPTAPAGLTSPAGRDHLTAESDR